MTAKEFIKVKPFILIDPTLYLHFNQHSTFLILLKSHFHFWNDDNNKNCLNGQEIASRAKLNIDKTWQQPRDITLIFNATNEFLKQDLEGEKADEKKK